MNRLSVSSCIVALLVLHFGGRTVTPAVAQISCDDPRIIERLPKPPTGCQKEKITASGGMSFFGLSRAQTSAERAWKRQVLEKFGERFTVWDNAACASHECVPAAIGGATRCTYTGFPCAEKPYLDTLELSRADVEEMQRLLKRAGFNVPVDGKFGDKTSEALRKWQRIKKFADDGLPNKENLERLQREEHEHHEDGDRRRGRDRSGNL
jgi:hypothetical protein